MNRGLCLALGVFLSIGVFAQPASSPFAGEWKLDTSRTRMIDRMKVENVSGNRYAFNFGGGDETILVDGTDQPAGGGTTLSVSVEGPGSWKVVRKKNGRLLLTGIWNLSKEGKTLTDDFTLIRPDGTGSTVRYLYRRTAGTSGFTGTWETTMNTSPVAALKIVPYGENGLSFIDSSQGITRNVKFDGKDYPIAGANLPPGLVCSGRVVNEHTLKLINKVKGGRTLNTEDVSVSSDRRTLTITMRTPGRRQPNLLVFERQ